MTSFPTIVKIETFIPATDGDGGDYHRQKGGHWILDGGKPHCELPDTKCGVSTPMSGWEKYRENRTSFGIDVLGSLVCIITASDGTQGVATGFGGPPACWLIENHFARFVVGADPRDTVSSTRTRFLILKEPQRVQIELIRTCAEPHVGANVQGFDVLRPERSTGRSHFRRRPRDLGLARQDPPRTSLRE